MTDHEHRILMDARAIVEREGYLIVAAMLAEAIDNEIALDERWESEAEMPF